MKEIRREVPVRETKPSETKLHIQKSEWPFDDEMAVYGGDSDISGSEVSSIGEVKIEVPGLRPSSYNKDGSVAAQTNFRSKLPNIIQEIDKKGDWWKKVTKDVREDKKKATFLIALGAIVVFVAGAAVEMNVREGKDLLILENLIEKHKRKKGKE